MSGREVTSILVKRQHINLGWNADDKYGHWWFEFGDPPTPATESYGWWPKHPVTAASTLLGTAGELNGQTSFGGTLTQDPHHLDTVEQCFHPTLADGDTRDDADIMECLRMFALNYRGEWRWTVGWGQNCHTFQSAALDHCGLCAPKSKRTVA